MLVGKPSPSGTLESLKGLVDVSNHGYRRFTPYYEYVLSSQKVNSPWGVEVSFHVFVTLAVFFTARPLIWSIFGWISQQCWNLLELTSGLFDGYSSPFLITLFSSLPPGILFCRVMPWATFDCLGDMTVSLPLATAAGGVPGMLGGMGMGMGDKTVRELFVGNTPQGTSDFVLLEFLNAAMKQVSLVWFVHFFSFFFSLFLLLLFFFNLSYCTVFFQHPRTCKLSTLLR